MPLYDFRAACGIEFEQLLPSWQDDNPRCPHCGGTSTRLLRTVNIGGGAVTPPSADSAPTSWEGTRRGDREYVAQWRRRLDERARFEERHPEFATRREAVAAHEGSFEHAPLTYRELAERAETSTDATKAAAEAGLARRTGVTTAT
ncbi:zinc ribbon domain-containing protein [Gordonia rubripertincta]|uniref:Zinc ribbon domain-containing protein n=1 Tax=Gordonia rubripertincta TaxID=36822 RepID=A0AAW4G481_GORRU|nr:zinc ribbon domain-containing protein [Gordonia rubripertincta]MBM7278015.1 zinc ribbon domain-containing protein [Gordonia rubripertincta]QMU22474.1 zinc ribbon domain-containing protein [Gordonia rubripertincta]